MSLVEERSDIDRESFICVFPVVWWRSQSKMQCFPVNLISCDVIFTI